MHRKCLAQCLPHGKTLIAFLFCNHIIVNYWIFSYCITSGLFAYTGHWLRSALLFLWLWSLIFYQKLKDFCLKKIKQCTKSFMGFRNKAKKLNSELLILKGSVLLSSLEHIRKGMKGRAKLEIFTSKNPLQQRGYFSPPFSNPCLL